MRRSPALLPIALAAAILTLAGCGGRRTDDAPGSGALTAWAHAGRRDERAALESQVAAFNAGPDSARIDLVFLPEGNYNAQVQAAALANELPDLLEFDGPYVYNYAWQNRLVPIDSLLSSAVRARLIPSILEQGTYRGRLYSVGQYDSGLGLFGRRSLLEAAGARIPEGPADAWTAAEFDSLLARLAARDPDGLVLDLKLSYTGEWFTYGFSPTLRSAGGGLIDRTDYSTAHGVLDGPESRKAMRWLQRWLRDPNRVDPNLDDAAFTAGRVALSWVGHWEYPRYSKAWGDDLVLLPLPDFGIGTRTGQGSWNWGVTTRCADPAAAVRFLEFLLRDENVLAVTGANGAVPATRSAAERSPLYGPEGPLRLYVVQLTEGYSVPRPRTPAYPVITDVFQKAFSDMRNGADVRRVLDRAAAAIDRDLRDNRDYPPVPPGTR